MNLYVKTYDAIVNPARVQPSAHR